MKLGSTTDKKRILFFAVSVFLFAAFAFQLVYHAARASVTMDEQFHILAGHRHWCSDFGINPEHPPLLKILATAPLNLRTLREPPWDCGSKFTTKPETAIYGSVFLVENGLDSTVIPTRVAASLMSILLALLIFIAAWEMFGRWEALTALAIVAFEPNFIAHGSIVTTDMAISATTFGAMYALYRYSKEQTWLRFLVTGLAFGLMLAAKHSAVIFVGILFALLIADTVLFRRTETRHLVRLLRSAAAFAGIFLIGLAILWSFYGFRYRAIPNDTAATISVADSIKAGSPEMAASLPARITEAISRTYVLPESYVLGMADVIAGGSRSTSLFGRSYPSGIWFFFPVAFAVKTNIAILFLLPLGLIFFFFTREKRREVMFLLTPAVVFFIFASSSNFTNGVRHILPIYGFLIVLSAAGAIWLCRRFNGARYALVALLVFNAAAAARTAPNYLAFANDLWGGYENTHRIFSQSDVDTGQSMKLVREYLAREGIHDCRIAASGVHPEVLRSEQPCRPMSAGTGIIVDAGSLIDPVPPVIEGVVVLTVRSLPPRGGDEYVPITLSEPLAFIGGNTYVFRGRFDVSLAAAMSRVQRSNHFLRANDFDQATAEGRQAVELAPNDARPHLVLGLALARSGQKTEARTELERAAELAKTDSRFRNAEVRANQELERMK
jgi:4-amino-4-deoxy-L-arabinose transferase-like glycosyltransferase